MTKELKIEAAKIIRDSLHNLAVLEKNVLDNEYYFTKLKYFISLLEGSTNEAYLDGIPDPDKKWQFISASKFYSLNKATQKDLRQQCNNEPVTTVGIGANIEPQKVRDKFDKLLGAPSLMQRVYFGKAMLSNKQIETIFRACIHESLIDSQRIYGADWRKLRVNEQMAILSLHFNCPKLVNEQTNFRQHIQNYVATNKEIYLKNAVEEILHRSNHYDNAGLQNRRAAEATLLASYYSPLYTKPNTS